MRERISTIISILAITVLFIVLPACCKQGELIHVKVGLSWLHEAQFAGLYWADKRGLYEEEGLAVELLPYQHEDLAHELVGGKYDFVILQTDTLLRAREIGLNVKALFADYQLMPTCYFSKKERNITKPEDLVGKTVGVAYSERYPLIAMLVNKGIEPARVNIVDREYNYQALADDVVDVEAGWVTDGDSVQAAVGEYNVIYPYNYAVNWYADLIVATEETIEERCELVEAFVRATMQGWEETISNADEAALLPQEYDPDTEAEHLKFVLQVSIPLFCTGEHCIGWMEESVFQQAQRFLLEQGILQDPLEVREVYTREFIEQGCG